MFRKTLKTLGQAFFSSTANLKQLQKTVNIFDDIKKDPKLVEHMKIMQNRFNEARANSAKCYSKEIEIDAKEIVRPVKRLQIVENIQYTNYSIEPRINLPLSLLHSWWIYDMIFIYSSV